MAPGGRKNKRNRNKRSNQQRTKNPSDRQQNNPNEESKSTVNSKSQDITEDEDGLIEAKVNGQAVKVTTEVETSPSSHEIGSITKQRETRRRYKLEHRVLNSQPKICEIKNVVGPPLEAIVSCIDHVAGVGILETGFANNTASQSGTIVTEPLEPLEPLPSGVTSRVETLGERYFALAQLPAPGDVNTDGPEIHEVSDSDIETSPVSSNRPALVVEAESDVELPSRSIRQTIVEESEEESSSTRQISLEESDSSDLSLCLQQNTTNNCFNNHSDDEASESTIIDNNTETDTDVEDNVEVGIDGAVEKESSEPARTRETSKGASKCDKLDEDTMDVESSEAMATKKVTVIAHNADSPSEIHEAPLTREVEDKLRIFIKGLDLPSLPKDNLLKDPECHELESCDVVAQKRVKNRAILETYYSESRHVDNFLDIIQEEGEKLSGDEEQHIRDFINGEIGKFCRITRPTGEDNGPGEKPKLTVNEKSKLILENEEDGLKSSFNGEEKVNETNEKELNVSDKPERVPLPPKRSSSLEKKITTTVRLSISSQVESAEVPPEIPALPTESAHSEENNNPPKRPELPAMKTSGTICCNIENQCEEISSKCSTPRLHNSVGEAGRFGNDDASCLEIARGHVNVMAAMRPLKISNHPTGSQRVSEVIPTSVAAIEVESLQPNTGKTTEKTEKNQYSPETRDCADEKIVKESSVTENYQNTKVNKIEEFRSERHEEVSKWLDTVTKSTKFSKTIEEEFNSVESETSESMCYKSSISQVVDGNNKTCVQSKSEKVSESIDLDIVPNRVDSSIVPIIIESSKADQSSSTIDCQTEDSSSSATSSSTVKYVSGGNRIDFTESVTPGKYNNKIRETNGDGSLELTPPPEDHLYYVPLEEQNGLKANKLDSKRPDLLKDLCILKILSMPYGAQIIKEITLPKFNILKNLETSKKTVETLENSREDTDSLLDTMKKRPKSWMGVPTIEDPRLLICLSPSQQEADIRTSADNLLDLHRKFLNRRSYHDDRRREISVPKYHIEVNSMEESGRGFSEHEGKELNQFQHPTAPPNRLLEIIKENPISKDSPGVTNSRKDVGQDRSKVTRLSDWLFSARSKPTDSNLRGEKTQSCEFSGEREPYDENIAAFSPFTERNGHISNSEKILDRGKCQSRFFYDIDGENSSIRKSPNDSSYNVNSALILQSTESLEQRSLSPINKNPITIKSAIIDKTPCYITESRKWAPISSPRGNIDLRHVNSALINDKPEAPPRRRRNVDVDRSCIDTTSIFDKAPPSGHLEARKYEQLCQDPETLKQATANEIIENLKRLQAGSRDVIDGRRRYSLPQEYFDRQMEYIEQLGDQLKEVILAEEEERKAFHDLDSHMNDETLDNHKNSIEESENNNVKRHEESWYEDTRIQEKDETRFSKEEGFRECRKKTITEESKHHIESSTELFENKESSRVISKGESSKDEDKLKWKKFVDDVSEDSKRPKSISIFPTDDEVFRRKMYDEYLREVQEREERKNHKVIKISSYVHSTKSDDRKEDGIMSKMEKEFIERAKNRLDRFGIKLDDSESEKVEKIKSDQTSKIETSTCKQSHHIKEAKCLIDGEEIKDARKLPKHLQEFLQLSTIEADKESMFAPTFKASSAKTGVWSPGSEPPPPPRQPSPDRGKNTEKDAGIPTVWTPSSAGASPVVERKEFRPVSFESPVLSRKKRPQTQISTEEVSTPPWKAGDKNETSHNVDHNITTRIVNSHSVPSQGLNTLASTPRLPRAQNPTITLLQKAREGQLPKGAAYLDETDIGKSHEGARISPGEIIYTIKREYESEPETEKDRPKKMADLGRRKVEGIGPITKGGMPVALRSEIKNDNHAKWYKQMYDSLHRAGKDDDYVTIRYKPRRGVRYGYGSSSGYLSEPEPRAYTERSATLDTRRRPRNKENEGSSISTMPRKSVLVKTTAEVYRNQPGRIENYEPGRSSIAEKEPTALAKEQWWDEVMDIFDGAESRQSQLRHPVALRTFIPTHQLVKSMHSIRATSTQSLHPKSSLRTTRAVLEQTDPDAIEVFGTTSRENHQPAVKFGAEPPTVSILLGRTNSTLNTDRVSYSMIKSPKCDRIATSRSRRHSRTSSRDSHSDDSMVVGFIDETIRQMDQEPDNWNSATLDERSKSFVLLNNNNSSSSRRSSPLIGNRSSPSNKDRSFLPMTSPRNHHRNHHHNQRQQHHDPSISSSTSSSSSSTIHITMLPPPPPITTSVIAESALTSPPRPFDQHNSHTPKPYMSHALKESGYESDSTLIFRRRDDVSPLSPLEQRLAYKTVQKGGDVPLHGFRKPAPERPKDDAEIEYFPISPTLTRLRLLRRRNGISSTAASMSSMTFARYKKTPSSSSSAAATIVPHQRVNSTEVITNRSEIVPRDLRVPSPPRRRSSRHNATLKFYASSGSTHPPNPRHEQCFAADSASNIRFLRERLSNKLLKHEQGRVSELTRRNLTSSRSSPIRLSSPTKVKLPTKTISVLPKRKIESTPVKSLTGPDKTIESRITKSAVEFKQRSSEEKPPIGRVNTKVSLSTDTSIRSTTTRTKTLPSCQKKYQAKVRNSRKETDESLKRHSSTDLSLAQAEVGRVLHGRRQVNVGNSLTGSNVKTNSSLLRVKSQDIALTKVISSSRESRKTRTVTSPLRSSSPALSISPCRRTTVNEISKQRTFPGKSREKLTTFVTSTIVCGDLSISKRIRDKPQTLVKSPTKKYETIESEEKDKRKKNTSKKEKTRETIKSKKLFNGKSDLERKKVKKVAGKSEIASKRDTISVTGETTLTMERIKKHQEATRTDSFFQNLFLRNIPSPATSQCSTLKRSSVMEQARIFQEFGNEGYRSEPSLRSLNIYLATKRPVSNSRFKNWERESISSRSSSPFGASWHGRSIFQKITKFDSLHGMDEFGSLTSLRGRSPDLEKKAVKERSLSEPPLRLSLTSDDQNKIPPSSSRSSSPTTGKSAACRRIRGLKQEKQDFPILKTRARSASEADDSERRRITFGSNLSLTKSTSSLESPPTNREDYQRYVFEMLHSQKKSGRYKDLHDFYASLERMGRLEKTTSSSELRPRLKNEEIIDYDRWKDIRSMERAEQELKVLYGKLKAVQRDKDFLFSTKDVENLRWRGDIGLRCRERSVENIRESFKRLAKGESELESTRRREIASKKDVYKPLWRGSSVVNVANSITKKANDEKNLDENDKWSVQPSLQKSLGGSKKFWSSLSIEQVNALKNQLNEIYGSDNNGKCKSTNQISEDKSINQLDKIQQIQESRITKSDYEVIVPPQQEFGDGLPDSGGLSVRCHSMLVQDIKLSTSGTSSLQRSGSICRGRYLDRSKSDKSSVLTESDKKRISQTLGKEILNKVSQQKRSPSPVAPRETRGAIAAASTIPKSRTGFTNTSPRTCYSLETPLDSETHKSRDKSDILLVLTPMDETSINRKKVESVLDEWSKKPSLLSLAVTPNTPNKNASGSEVDSATESSENSVKTVVQREKDAEDVLRKVEFFERIERENKETTVDKKKKSCRLSASQSVADLKELFGETESARFATLPFRSSPGSRVCSGSPGSDIETKRRSISASPDVPYGRFSTSARINLDRPRSVSPCRVSTSTCSIDSPRHRSASPDPERYWRAYLNLVKHGSVRKLRAKFESLEELSGDRIKLIPTPKRFQSDPELTRNLLKTSTDEKKTYFKTQEIPDVAWLRRKYEPVRGRAKKRLSRSPTIPRIPLRLEDLSMPHINVISKTIELKDSVMSRSSSTNSLAIKAETEELEAKRPVGRIREKFEKLENLERTSILGEMFTSAPDVHELRDISPYLAGGWVAHKYPSRRDNSRSISLPPELRNKRDEKYIVGELSGRSTLPKRHEKIKEYRGVSTSPMRPRTPTSILKQPQTDPFANQVFDASKHRPKYRYQPPPPPPPLPAPSTIANRRQIRRSWWPPIATYTARPTVTFEEYTNAPPPPPKSHHCRTERQESPRRYVEGEVTIHYRSPVRTEAKEILSEEELARRSAENMRRVYQEERRRKYLQELHDIDSRRHTDNFVPSQKSPIPLNRYDDFLDDLSYRSRSQEQTPEPRLVARAMYNFVGQTSKELSFRRGDIILVRRQIDKNWYEGEHNAMIGLFPINYVEILPYDSARSTPKKSYEGQARAKFNFLAQTNLELSLAKGELVVLTRRVDENWYEGRIGNKKGIFPVTYVEVLVDPGQQRPETPVSSKPVASPAAHSMLSNGTASGKMSMGPHHYTPSIPVKTSTTEPQYISLPRIGVTDRNKLHVAPVNETLHIDTHSDTIPYRALYNYRPQNEDELELKEGDTVYVMEKCDDGWFVGSSQRTGYFGTFPGNYVERL